ncbi:MAG: hypothetical protein JNL74_22945, partial [Fibrobacteres bacterium]|nr:hypothetical protein [Fibrobacterota bacterium]
TLATTLISSHFPDAVFDRMKSITTDKSGNIWFVNGTAPSSKLTVIGKNILASTDSKPVYYSTNPANPSAGLMVKYGQWKNKALGVPESKRGLDAFLSEKKVNTIASDMYGDLWIATTSGLFYYSEGRDSSIYGNIDGNWRFFLPGMNITCLAFDTLNNTWIGTDSGLCMLDFSTARYPTENREYGPTDRSKIQLQFYGKMDGLINTSVISLAVNRKSGNVFIGTKEGVQVLESGAFFSDKIDTRSNSPGISSRQNKIQITTKAPGSTLAIYTLSGKLIFSTKLPPYESAYIWDCKIPESNKTVAPGVYLYKTITPSKITSFGKFALVK